MDRWLVQNPATPAFATVLVDRPQPVNSRVFLRGNPQTRGDEVSRQFLGLFGRQSPFTKGSGRLELAQQLVAPDNPLVARVIVNRLWHHHFGAGLVRSVGPGGHGAAGKLRRHLARIGQVGVEQVTHHPLRLPGGVHDFRMAVQVGEQEPLERR